MAEMIEEANRTVAFRTSPCFLCGKVSVVRLHPDRLEEWQDGAYVQDVWPEKTADERELLMTGTHPECWKKAGLDDEPEGDE
jgi:hypothetical protein